MALEKNPSSKNARDMSYRTSSKFNPHSRNDKESNGDSNILQNQGPYPK